MPAERGDQRPCTSSGCAGTMQYGRESDNDARQTPVAGRPVFAASSETKGWICSKETSHFLKGD